MRWYVISGSTGYSFSSDKISGRTFDGNNDLFLLCMCHLFFLIYTHRQLLLFLEKWNLGILHLRIFLQRKFTAGLHFPKTRTLDVLIQTGRKRMTLHKSAPTQEVAGKSETAQLVESGRNQLMLLQTYPITALGSTFGLSHLVICLISFFLTIWLLSRWNSFTYNKTSLPMELP